MDCLNFLQSIFFPFSPVFLCNLVRKSPQKCGEIELPDSRRRKGGRILSRLWLSWFFRSENVVGERGFEEENTVLSRMTMC